MLKFKTIIVLLSLVFVFSCADQLVLNDSQADSTTAKTYPLPPDDPEAILDIDESKYEPIPAPAPGVQQELTGLAAIEASKEVCYDVKAKTVVLKNAVSSSLARGGAAAQYTNGYIPANLQGNGRSVIGTDDRYAIVNNTNYPYSTFCKLYMTFFDGTTYRYAEGSGTIVGWSEVLTAGHCVYYAPYGGWAVSMTIVPCKSGSYAPFGTAYASYFNSIWGWTGAGDNNHDFGVVKLDREIGRSTGWHGYARLTDGDTAGKSLRAFGYPGNRSSGLYCYYGNGYVQSYNTYTIQTYADITPGQSGGPVLITTGPFNGYLFAVNSWEYGSYNQCVRLDGYKYDCINS